jgi:hypothetical protein
LSAAPIGALIAALACLVQAVGWETLAWPRETLGQDACDGLEQAVIFATEKELHQSTARNNQIHTR